MTRTEELKKQVRNTKSISGLINIRNSTNNTIVISYIKEHIKKLLLSKGYEEMSVNMSSLRNIALNMTDCNDYNTINVPDSNRIFKKYAGKKMKLYVNEKSGNTFQNVNIFVK